MLFAEHNASCIICGDVFLTFLYWSFYVRVRLWIRLLYNVHVLSIFHMGIPKRIKLYKAYKSWCSANAFDSPDSHQHDLICSRFNITLIVFGAFNISSQLISIFKKILVLVSVYSWFQFNIRKHNSNIPSADNYLILTRYKISGVVNIIISIKLQWNEEIRIAIK